MAQSSRLEHTASAQCQHSIAQQQLSTTQVSTVQHSTASAQCQHSTAHHNSATAQHCSGQHSTAQNSTAQHSTAQHGTVEHFWCYIVSSASLATVVTLRSLWQGVVPRSVGCLVLHLKVKALSRGEIQQAFMCTCPGLDLLISFFQPTAL